ncbi:MAG TPA: pyrimidine 5'-nucleotidase [Anaerolineales bacterium]|nr:pyrimidine 5'-nucleotidase [Anaerolineales bacterium]
MARFATLLLDLDDTLYPASSGLWEAIGDRINRFMVEHVGIEPERAPGLRRFYFEHYGTSLNGLIRNHGIDPYAYLRFVHDLPLADYLAPDPQLRFMIENLAIAPVIFTNADTAHARRVLTVLGISDLIDQVIDIIALDWINKPEVAAYRRALELCHQPDPRQCLVVDDQLRNLAPASDLGMGTVLVGRLTSADGVDHTIERAADLLGAVPELKRTPAHESWHSTSD